ncbi:unnamed protein product [Taenia asiatica]|uniref:Aryl hydrocarbon receptor nuclear translocator n=1 Tax=Taenia asiatica TaxID=60517 RepID=A0A0R3WBU4_TAEAS|nr:unnamed protein product [Taenia asiatica]
MTNDQQYVIIFALQTTISICEGGNCNGCAQPDKEESYAQLEKERSARENHCQIERRRRNKMSAYINELCSMLPSCSSVSRKPDKLTILRMAVSHLKTLRGATNISDGYLKPSFLSDQELKHLILEAADGFLFVCRCDTGKVIYVSDSVSSVLSATQSDWYQRTVYDLCHPDDGEKIREQLVGVQRASSCAALGLDSPRDSLTNGTDYHKSADPSTACITARVLDLKSGIVKREGSKSRCGLSDDRRGFICRMKLGNLLATQVPSSASTVARQARLRHQQIVLSAADSVNGDVGDFAAGSSRQRYALMHVTGYVKSVPSTVESPNTVNADGFPISRSSTDFVVSLLDRATSEGMNGAGSGVQEPGTSREHSQPLYFVALARLQLTNLPNAADLTPHRTYQFTVRLDEEKQITFCDHRISNVFTSPAYSSVSPEHILGTKFTDLIVNPDEIATFCDVFNQVWKSDGRKVEVSLHLRPPPRSPTSVHNETSPPDGGVDVKCSIYAFKNPYSKIVEYAVCTLTSVMGLQASTASKNAQPIYYSTFTSTDSQRSQQQQEQQLQDHSDGGSLYWCPVQCPPLQQQQQQQRGYVLENVVSTPHQYDFCAAASATGCGLNVAVTQPKFLDTDEEYAARLGESRPINSHTQSQSVAHQPYLHTNSSYTHPQRNVSFTATSVYSSSSSSEGVANRTSAISYLPRSSDQRNGAGTGDWHL